MSIVTLIGKEQATKGAEFIYIGPLVDCKNCKLRNVCFNLKPGRRYKIKEVRDKKHTCDIFEEGVVVVEVEEQPVIATISTKHIQGSTVSLEPISCHRIGCPHHQFCTSSALKKGASFTVTKVLEPRIECAEGHHLQKVELDDKK